MIANPLAQGSIGKRHAEMPDLVRNPFRTKFMRNAYDIAVQTYATKHRDFIYPWGARCVGNSPATRFWRGFDGVEQAWDAASRQSPAYAFWRAGKDVRAAIVRGE